jgi:hypoxanthine phosphoribosyltransferase
MTEGKYVPNAILGISNGGGAFLDFLARKMNFDGPIACLWANRRHTDPDQPNYINNPVNLGIIKGVREVINKLDSDTRILVVDDLIASGTTSKMALTFLTKQFDGCHLAFLPLFYRAELDKQINEILVWRHLSYDQERINAIHMVQHNRFPYDKNL